MSKYQMRISFDRENRTYRFVESITGKVAINSQAKFTCRRIWIDYYWRTHGKGNTDKGNKNTQWICVEPVQFQRGDHREFPFAFTAPTGPMTYHGENLNVDWYLSVHGDVPLARDVKCEEDFILLASESPDAYILGNQPTSMILPSPHQEIRQQVLPLNTYNEYGHPQKDPFSRTSDFHLALTLIIALGIFTILINIVVPWWGALIYTFILSMLFYFGLRFLLNIIAKQKMKINVLQVGPSAIYAGEQVNCRLQFETKGAVFLENIAALLSAEEVVTSGAGTNTSTLTHKLRKDAFVKPYHEHLLSGRWIDFDCVLPIPPDAPATFQAANNNISWSVKLKVTFKRWPSWEKTVPITILPGYIS